MTARYKLKYTFPVGGIPKGTVFEGNLETYSGLIKAGIVQVIEEVPSGKGKVQSSRNAKDSVQPPPGDKSVASSDEGRDEQSESPRRHGSAPKVNNSANPTKPGAN